MYNILYIVLSLISTKCLFLSSNAGCLTQAASTYDLGEHSEWARMVSRFYGHESNPTPASWLNRSSPIEQSLEEKLKKIEERNAEVEKQCPVCFEEADDDMIKLDCGHEFHRKCLKEWYLTPVSTNLKCPVCRQEMKFKGQSVDVSLFIRGTALWTREYTTTPRPRYNTTTTRYPQYTGYYRRSHHTGDRGD